MTAPAPVASPPDTETADQSLERLFPAVAEELARLREASKGYETAARQNRCATTPWSCPRCLRAVQTTPC
jgi:hypothetical protein